MGVERRKVRRWLSSDTTHCLNRLARIVVVYEDRVVSVVDFDILRYVGRVEVPSSRRRRGTPEVVGGGRTKEKSKVGDLNEQVEGTSHEIDRETD